jgi:hypothetical protein
MKYVIRKNHYDMTTFLIPKMKIASLLILFTLASSAFAGELKPFTTDGCSDFPNGTPKHQDLWLTCCIEHDLAYWMGGTYKERLEADKELKACVEKVGEPAIAKLMMAGVRVGGTPFLPTSFRWGYGWKYSRGYKPLTKEEREQVNKMLSGHTKE